MRHLVFILWREAAELSRWGCVQGWGILLRCLG